MSDRLEDFIWGLWYQANWRAGKAVEDERNANAADAIRSLAQWLRRHSDDPVGMRLDAALESLFSGDDDDDSNSRLYAEILQRASTFGFDEEKGSATDDACERFIKALAEKIEVSRPTKPRPQDWPPSGRRPA